MRSHGSSSSARVRSMIQGVRPPLTAITNWPRSAAAERASAAIAFAAACAADVSSANTSVFILSPFAAQPLKPHEWQETEFRARQLGLASFPVELRVRLHSGPTNWGHTETLAFAFLVPDPQCATLLRRSPHAQTTYCLQPLLPRALARKRPFPLRLENGWPPFPRPGETFLRRPEPAPSSP